MGGKNAFINTEKPRYIGNEIFGNGDCEEVYLGDTVEDVLPQVTNILESMGDDPRFCGSLRINIKMMTDLEVDCIPEM